MAFSSARTSATPHWNWQFGNQKAAGKVPICNLYSALSWPTHLYGAQVRHVLSRDHTVLPVTDVYTLPAFTPQLQSITTLWPVLNFHPAEGRRV